MAQKHGKRYRASAAQVDRTKLYTPLEAITLARRQLGFGGDDVDVFVTHSHFDHRGLAFVVAGDSGRVFMSAVDAEAVRYQQTPAFPAKVREIMLRMGVTGVEYEELGRYEQAVRQEGGAFDFDRLTLVGEGDRVSVGDRDFQVIMVPGHTPGHAALVHPASGSVFFGDAVLMHINPCVMPPLDGRDQDMVQAQLDTMERIGSMDLAAGFLGHGPADFVATGQQVRDRARAIEKRVRDRIEDVCAAVAANAGMVGTDVAKSIPWSVRTDQWSAIPFMKRFIMYAEVDAYLDHLVRTGALERELQEGMWKYACRA